MGRHVAKINKTYASYGDYSWDYIERNKPKKYYDEARIKVDLVIDDQEKVVEVPLFNLVDIKLVKSNYTWDWNDKKTLHSWLYKYLKEKGEKIEGYVEVRLHSGGINYDKPEIEGYYLQSDIGDENIILSTKKKLHEIKTYDDYRWLRLRYMYLN